jgi:hypothetical protein
MKLINPKLAPKFAAAACLFGMLAAPTVFAGHHPPPWYGPPPPPTRMPEPSSLVMTLVGMGFGVGLAVVGLRRKRGVTA